MSWKEHQIERLYYSIGEAAEMIGVEHTSAIRFWEQEFQLIPVRNRKGNRKYTVDEISLMKVISEAVKELKLTTVKRLLNEGGEERLQEVLNVLAKKKKDADHV